MAENAVGASRAVIDPARKPGPVPGERPDDEPSTDPDVEVDVKAPAEDIEEDTEPDAGTDLEPARSRRMAVVVVVGLLLVVLGLVAVCVLLASDVLRANDEASDREAALAAGRQSVVNLLSIDPKTVEADVERVLASATGTFRADFANNRDTFADVVRDEKVTSVGSVKRAGIKSVEGDTVTLLMAVHATVTNSSAKKSEDRNYRLKLVMKREGDEWLMSHVEFVP